ncbi:MAG: glycosyltransferase family 2 protein [Rhodospirillales bacterium]|jgi:glycosyltransferase involved in cell wall biosynthesis|nr:glycosyltransferase family 2 protein [Rhodospirillales bacterium]
MSNIALSILIVAHNEEERLASCLDKLSFADEIVVVLDKCTDNTKQIAERYTDRLLEGSWDIEGDRRNAGIEFCRGEWVLEVDSDEHVSEELAHSVRHAVETSTFGWHEVPVDNFVGGRLVRYGWGCSFGTSAVPRLARKGVKVWGKQRVHPSLIWKGEKGPRLTGALDHYVDRNISDMIRRLDSYSTAKAKDMRAQGEVGSTANNIRRLFSRFLKCYVSRKGYREGGYGLLIALCAGLYPLLSHLKAKLEQD